MSLLEELQQGRLGLRFKLDAGLEVIEADETFVMLGSRERGFSLYLGQFSHRLDLRPENESLLLRDIERHARDLFDSCYRSVERPDPKDRPRTEDPAWSPVIEANVLSLGKSRALRVVHRLWYEPGREAVMGHLLVPLAEGLFEFRITPATATLTGTREVMLFNKSLTKAKAVDRDAPIRPLPQAEMDDPAHDADFPAHPLTVTRRELRALVEEAGIEVTSPAAEESKGPDIIATAGFSVTPPPRYLLSSPKDKPSKRATWSRVSFSGTDGIDMLTVSRTGTRLDNPSGLVLSRIAEKITKQSVPAGAENVRISARALPDTKGRKHAETYRAYVEHASRQHSIFRWIADEDGEVIMIAVGASQCVPVEEMAADAEAVASSYVRVGGGGASPPSPAKAAKKKWWQIF